MTPRPAQDATLADVPVGGEATVLEVRCERAVSRRLMEMGLLPGTRVRVLRVAPLGDPVVLSLRSYALSIRRSEASSIVVDRAPSPALEAWEEPAGARALR